MEPRESEIEPPTDTEKVLDTSDTSHLEEKVETTQDNNNLYVLGRHNFWMDLNN